ncbi:ATP-binding protein [Alphaproteobacteria bacterium]|nr:ATP-binding protein [Alphaproteobacteria bacterium]
MNKTNEIILYAFRGLPGSGKTSFAKSLNLKFFEADHYFEKFNNNKYDFKLLKKAHQYCYQSVKEELKNGKSVIVSNTMTSQKEVKEYQDLAKKLNVKFVSVILENRHNGKSLHNVPTSSIEKMKKRFDIKLI